MNRFINELFVVDVLELKVGGKLRALLLTAVARLIGSYNQLVSDVGINNNILKAIMVAAQKAQIDDDTGSIANGRRWLVVLKGWSKRVETDFNDRNPESATTDASLAQQVAGIGNCFESLSHRFGSLEVTVVSRASNWAAIKTLTQQVELERHSKSRKTSIYGRKLQGINESMLQRVLAAAVLTISSTHRWSKCSIMVASQPSTKLILPILMLTLCSSQQQLKRILLLKVAFHFPIVVPHHL